MPGIWGIFTSNRNNNLLNRLEQAIKTTEENKTFPFSFNKLYDRKNNIIGSIKHQNWYPIHSKENKDRLVILEGLTYNVSIQEFLENLENTFCKKYSTDNLMEKVREIQQKTDGQYIAIIVDKNSGETIVFNDLLGRLPLYYYKADTFFIFSRWIRLILLIMQKVDFDTLALAEFLVFLYPLGDKTLFQNIKRLMPASLIVAKTKRKSEAVKILKTYNWNFDPKPYATTAEKLANLLMEITRSRIATIRKYGLTPVFSLSGGIDSRTVLASFILEGMQPRAITYVEEFLPPYETLWEIHIAKKVGKLFKLQHEIFDLSRPPTYSEALRLVYLVDGLCYTAFGYTFRKHNYLRRYGEKYALILGAGGDKLLQPLKFPRQARNIRQLARCIIERESILPPSIVAKLLKNVTEDDILTSVIQTLQSYPEKTLEGKNRRFMILEHSFKFLFKGCDRERFFCWTIVPMFSSEFVKTTAGIPEKEKENYKLYRKVMMILDKRLCIIPYYNIGLPPHLAGCCANAFD